LLGVTRADIEAYCAFHGLEPRFDRSNLDTTYFRNWLRHEVLPLLAQHNPNIREVIRRSARVMAGDYALLRSLLEETWPRVVLEEAAPPPTHTAFVLSDAEGPILSNAEAGGIEGDRPQRAGRIVFDLAAWRALPTTLQRSTLREAIHRLRRSLRNINFLHVENALGVARDGTTGDQSTLPQGLMLTVGYDRFAVAEAAAASAGADPLPDWPLLPPEAAPLPVTLPGDTPLPGAEWVLRAEVRDRADLPPGWEANADPWQAFLDAQVVGGSPLLRTRRPGDRFQPLGMDGHTAKLADFLTNQKVPRAIRDRLPLLVGEVGILWVCGWRVAERARVQNVTAQVAVLRFVRLFN
jgi:tRNA(Ile)-lysidine synthase